MVRRAHGRLTRALRDALAEYGLGIGEFQVLRALYSADGLSQSEVSEIIEVEKGALTKLFYSMEVDGYIRRPRDAGDSRRRNIFLAPRGEALRAPVLAVTRAVNDVACRGIPPKDVETMMRVLDQITLNVDSIQTHGEHNGSRNRR